MPKNDTKLMELKVFNTLTSKKEVFTPIADKAVGMYVCGPTCMYVGMCMRLNYVTAKAVEHYFIGNNLRSVST